MKKFFEPILNLVFPPRCEVCKINHQAALCPDCFSEIKFMKPQLGIHSVSAYDGALRTAVHRFKFKNRKRLSEPLGIVLVHYLSQAPTLDMEKIDLIMPVPLHSKRLRQRGFNQTLMLAEVVSRYFEKPIGRSLKRARNTKAQFDLPRAERFKNLTDAFAVTEIDTVFNKRILLLDDIYTTGATISECTKALNKAGARRVEVLTLSRAVED